MSDRGGRRQTIVKKGLMAGHTKNVARHREIATGIQSAANSYFSCTLSGLINRKLTMHLRSKPARSILRMLMAGGLWPTSIDFRRTDAE
jgi:hypothetical protein